MESGLFRIRRGMRWRAVVAWILFALTTACGGPSFAPAASDAGDVVDARSSAAADTGSSDAEAERDVAGDVLEELRDVDAGDDLEAAAGDARACMAGPAPAYPACGCQAPPSCSSTAGLGCRWQIGPAYCTNGAPECELVPIPPDGGC